MHCPAFRRLQGKTQLFPGESDFFRNRLTHSLEVSQIAKGIAIRLNNKYFKDAERLPVEERDDYRISTDLVEFAALAHDLGHPPFGHNGEAALDECMITRGGFEGNAQTLRILSRLEKKRTVEWPPIEFRDGEDLRRGLNLTYRALASILKYDKVIPPRNEGDRLEKGYYEDEAPLVEEIKLAVTGQKDYSPFKTIECQIMDVADDIAYSTFDFEDAMKAGFTSLLDMLRLSSEPVLLPEYSLRRRIAVRVWKKINDKTDLYDREKILKKWDQIPNAVREQISDTEEKIAALLLKMCRSLIAKPDEVDRALDGAGSKKRKELKDSTVVSLSYKNAKDIQEDAYLRTALTSQFVGEFIQGVDLEVNANFPALSKLTIDPEIELKIEVLKNYTREAHIDAARLKSIEFRGKEIVRTIFECLEDDNDLLPADWRIRCAARPDPNHKRRCVTDFIAGMTDRHALAFFHRLKAGDPGTIFREL
ncbi:deoxyguanosinetriphosphate triphosphohydrolase family protein [Bradyrhizobium sp. DASA03120]|uniref:deoxyguanosinetriphosphate triphosphohydrolase family protein n=1 Tax=Bradyrhizobium sp. SMVTL-02 TaxID=3395917 RepID=UPI003F6EAA61